LPIVKERETGPFRKELCRGGRPLMWSLGSSVATWHESQERRDKDKGSQGDTIRNPLSRPLLPRHPIFCSSSTKSISSPGRVSSAEQWTAAWHLNSRSGPVTSANKTRNGPRANNRTVQKDTEARNIHDSSMTLPRRYMRCHGAEGQPKALELDQSKAASTIASRVSRLGSQPSAMHRQKGLTNRWTSVAMSSDQRQHAPETPGGHRVSARA